MGGGIDFLVLMGGRPINTITFFGFFAFFLVEVFSIWGTGGGMMSLYQGQEGPLSKEEFVAWFNAATAALTAGDSDANVWNCLLASRTSGDIMLTELLTLRVETLFSGLVVGVTHNCLNRVLSLESVWSGSQRSSSKVSGICSSNPWVRSTRQFEQCYSCHIRGSPQWLQTDHSMWGCHGQCS